MAAQFAAYFRDRFGPYLKPQPEPGTLYERLRLVEPSMRNGRQYRGPWRSASSQGFTTTSSGGMVSLNAAITPAPDEYILDACNLFGREIFTYDEIMRAKNGVSADGGSNAGAYMDPLDDRMESLMKGGLHHAEILTAYGAGSGATILADIGVIATVPVFPGTGPNYGSATHPIVQLTHGSWCDTLWVNSQGMLVDIVNAAGTATVETGVTVEFVSGAGPCAVQLFKTGSAVAVAAGDRLIPSGHYQNACAGVQAWLANTGTLANINAGQRPLWNALKFNAGGTKMTRARMFQVANQLINRGAKGELDFYCNLNVCSDLEEEHATVQRWEGNDYSVAKQGVGRLQFAYGGGVINVKGLTYAKQAFSFMLESPDHVYRIGASDLTVDGADGDTILFNRPDHAGQETRIMAQFAPFFDFPAHNALVHNIKSTADSISVGDVT